MSVHSYYIEKRLFGRSKRVWQNNAEINLKEIRWDSVSWVQLAQDREKCSDVMNTITNLRAS
jgi:hypothetical protein